MIRVAGYALCSIPILIGLVATVAGAWVCDDAFITFRYIDNFKHGLGLVYNAGERVEGYTHFLWTILLAALRPTGTDLVELGRVVPILFHCGTLALLVVRAARRTSSEWTFLPVAAWGVALHRDMQIWGSGGLETAAFTFFVTATVLAASASVVRPGRVAALAALATLFRPEGLMLSACALGYLAWRRHGGRTLASFAGVWLALVAPLVAWRRVYYHDWLPNTFYAKSAAFANWEQGWRYVWLYFSVYPILAVALVAAIVLGVRAVRRDSQDPMLLCAGVCVIMLFSVVRLGGDFMFARFLIPVTPLLYLALEDTIHRQPRVAFRVLGAALVVAATGVGWAQRDRILTRTGKGIADEHKLYDRAFVDGRRLQGQRVASTFRGLDVRICTLGSQASFAYFAEFPYVLEKYGLTDRELARRQLAQRSRPGHEKKASEADMVARRIHFVFRGDASQRTNDINDLVIDGLLASIIVYDRAVMDPLRGRPGVQFIDYPTFLDDLVTRAGTVAPAERQRIWQFFERYYFSHNEDPDRRARTRAALVGPP